MKEVSVYTFIQSIKENIRVHLIIGVSVSVLALIILLLLPNIYKSTLNILPNEKYFSGSAGLLGNLGTSLSSKASSLLGGGSEETDKIMVILESESTKKYMVDKFSLIYHYELEDEEFAYTKAKKLFDSNTAYDVLPEGNILIEVKDEFPKVAYEMANEFRNYLDSALKVIDVSEAKQNRVYIEKRLQQNRADIDSVQNLIEVFQKETGIYSLEEQLTASFALVGESIGATIEAEMSSILEKNFSKIGSDAYKNVDRKLDLIQQSRKTLFSRIKEEHPPIVFDYAQLPAQGKRYFDLTTELTVQIEIQKVILPLFEQALMEEQKSLVSISVVDYPEIPEKKAEPKRMAILVSIILVCGIFQLIVQYFLLTVKLNS